MNTHVNSGSEVTNPNKNVQLQILERAVERITGSGDAIVQVAAGAGNDTIGNVVLTSDTGAIVTAVSAWTYTVAGRIASVVPSSGQLNTRVTIVGDSLLSLGTAVSVVTLAGVPTMSILSFTNTRVEVIAARSNASLGDVVVVGNTGGRVTLRNQWQYMTEGVILSINPTSGQQGTQVDIFGLSLRGYGGRVVNVSLAGIPAQIKEEADLFVTVIAGVGSSVTGDVLLTSDAGATVTRVAGWSYVAAGTVSSVTPSQGEVGTMVTIFGTGLLSGGNFAVEVTLRGVRARIVSQNSTVIVVQAYPARQLGVGDVRITADTGAFLVQTNVDVRVRQ